MTRFKTILLASTTVATALSLSAISHAHAPTTLAPNTIQEETPLPTAQEVIDGFIKAVGGEKAIKAQKSRMLSGTMSIPAMAMEGPMVIYQARPNLMMLEINLPGMGKSLQGFNGKVGWSVDPMRGPSLMTGEMLTEFKRDADFDSELNLFKIFDEVKVVGREDFNGTPCIKMLLKKGEMEQHRFFDEKTNLLIGSKAKVPTQMGKVDAVTITSDYKDFDGLKIATKTSIELMGMKQVMTVEKVVIDKVEPGVFKLPPAIQALADAEEKKAEEKKDEADKSTDTSSGS